MMKTIAKTLLALVAICAVWSCSSSVRFTPGAKFGQKATTTRSTAPNRAAPVSVDSDFEETGMASYYGDEFDGRPTSSGEEFDQTELTAAHKTLPFGTVVTVTNLDNGRSVTVRINDRGPFAAGRIIDLSRAAAESIGMIESGTARVRITIE